MPREKMSEINVKPSDVLDELRNCQDDVPIFRRLIRFACSRDFATAENTDEEWKPVLRHVVEIISGNDELGNERVALACRAFYALLSTRPESRRLTEIVTRFLRLESRDLHYLERRYVVSDLELFKLLNAYVYMHADRRGDTRNDPVLLTIFDIVRRNCARYTRYSYFAYKVLGVWLRRTRDRDVSFWERRDIVTEQRLEAVIFSNWSNAFQDVRKLNTQLFGAYLRVMSDKYDGFLGHVFDTCDKNVSWQNETRFTILAEVLRLWRDVETMTEKLTQVFVYKLLGALTNKALRSAATKVYLVILGKVSGSKWPALFTEPMETMVVRWISKETSANLEVLVTTQITFGRYFAENLLRNVASDLPTSEDFDALYALCDLWLYPTLELHKDNDENILTHIIQDLWRFGEDVDGYLHSYLLLTTVRLRIPLPPSCNFDYYSIYYINDRNEATRANIFAALCHHVECRFTTDLFFRIKHFLWFNANASTVCTREHIVTSVKMLYSKILRTISIQGHCTKPISDFTIWLHEFLLDCLEIGSCYQRKILALKLYTVLLDFTSKDLYKSCDHKIYLRNVATIDKYLRATNTWRFTNKESLFVLLRLVLDSTLDVRQLAADLILKYFEKDALSTADKDVIYECGLLRCNSSKFYEIESGATLLKIAAHWASPDEARDDSSEMYPSNCANLLLDTARQQLALMKSDILKAVVQNCPFYGMLTALLAIAFRAGPESRNLTLQFTGEVLSLAEDAADFFLSALFTKESNTAYSSSFAEMGLAINEHIRASEMGDCNYDELQLSPAHQVLVSCIWMSLKVLCEVASEIGMLMQSDAMVKSSMDIIVTVLLKCRHKGVMESAGVAIANLSRHLYNKKEYRELPRTYLTNLLEEDAGGKLLHLTRRGAGLTIMFHRLVVSDKRKNRPTVHFAMEKLLRSLGNFSVTEMRRVESEEDSPWARRLYFLRTLVADKEIHYSLVPYMEEICLRCFDYIESDVWTVRNASLQLYGAVVPRLVGQCSGGKGDDSLDSYVADGYSFNHFVTHYPTLARRMLTQLRATAEVTGTSGAALRSYARVAHTLALLSRMWTGGCDLVDYPSTALVERFRELLYRLCEKPTMHIRRLAAKAYVALTPLARVGATLCTIQHSISESTDDNRSYGLLLIDRYFTRERVHRDHLATGDYIPFAVRFMVLCEYAQEQCDERFDAYPTMETFRWRYRADVLTAWRGMCESTGRYKQPCYMLEAQICDQNNYYDLEVSLLLANCFDEGEWSIIERVTPSQRIQPGFFQFLSFRALFYAWGMERRAGSARTLSESASTVARILDSSCTEQSVGFLNGLWQSVPLFEFILTYLISMRDDHDPLLLAHIVTLARKMMRNDCLFKNRGPNLDDLARRFCEIEASTVATNPSVIYMKHALILAFSEREALINDALSHVLGLCAHDEESTRLAATDYVDFALGRFARLTNEAKFALMKCCLILLRDEVAEIRDVVSTSLQKRMIYPELGYCSYKLLKHEEIIYQRFLDVFIRRLADGKLSTAGATPNDQVANVISYFTREIGDSADPEATIGNPFYHDDATFYKEESKFLSLCYMYMKLREKDESGFMETSDFFMCCVTCAIEISRDLRRKIAPDFDDLRTVLRTKETDYVTRKRDFVLQYLSTHPVSKKLLIPRFYNDIQYMKSWTSIMLQTTS